MTVLLLLVALENLVLERGRKTPARERKLLRCRTPKPNLTVLRDRLLVRLRNALDGFALPVDECK